MAEAVTPIDALANAYYAANLHGKSDPRRYAEETDKLLKETCFPLDKTVQIIDAYIKSSGFFIYGSQLQFAAESTIARLVDRNLSPEEAVRLIPAFSQLSDYAESVPSLFNATSAALDYMAAKGYSAEEIVQELQQIKAEMKKQHVEKFPKWRRFLIGTRFSAKDIYPLAFRNRRVPNF